MPLARYLVIAHQTAETPELLAALHEIEEEDAQAAFILLIPATPLEHLRMVTAEAAAAVAEQAAVSARAHYSAAGIVFEDVRVSDPNPVVAATEELHADDNYAGLVVSTFAAGISRWLHLDVVSRIERLTAMPVTHVISHKDTAEHSAIG